MIELTLFIGVLVLVYINAGWLLSQLLSAVTRRKIRVGWVSWRRVGDLSVSLPRGLTLLVDELTFTLFTSGKPVKIEVKNARVIAGAGGADVGRGTEGGGSDKLAKILNWLQYASMSVDSVDVALLGVAVPGCLLHATINHARLDTFLCRDGVQVELTTRNSQVKVCSRNSSQGQPNLVDVDFDVSISADIKEGSLTRIHTALNVSKAHVFQGIFDHLQPDDAAVKEEEDKRGERESRFLLQTLLTLPEAKFSLKKLNVEYRTKSRTMGLKTGGIEATAMKGNCCVSVRQLVVMQGDVGGASGRQPRLGATVEEMSVHVQSAEGASDAGVTVHCRVSDARASVSVADVAWWQSHAHSTGWRRLLRGRRGRRESASPLVTYYAEVNGLVCHVRDEAISCRLALTFVSLNKPSLSAWELSAEKLVCLMGKEAELRGAESTSTNVHKWGEVFYMGLVIVQYSASDRERKVVIGMDGCKMEWSELMMEQMSRLLNRLRSDNEEKIERKKQGDARPLILRATVEKLVAIVSARQHTVVAVECDRLIVERAKGEGAGELKVYMEGARAAIGPYSRDGVNVSVLRHLKQEEQMDLSGEGQETEERWNQPKLDARKAAIRKAHDALRHRSMRLCASAAQVKLSLFTGEQRRQIVVESKQEVYVAWSPLLHRVLFHVRETARASIAPPQPPPPDKAPLGVTVRCEHPLKLLLELPDAHRMLWLVPQLSFHLAGGEMRVESDELRVVMNGCEILFVNKVRVLRYLSDILMDSLRDGLQMETTSNKGWSWNATSLHFHLPYQFNFAEVFSQFLVAIKWIKMLHGMKKKTFTAESPLPADFQLNIESARLELDDDPFENRLQGNFELKEDEVFECWRRLQVMDEKIAELNKNHKNMPQSKIDALYASLEEKNAAIYQQRWRDGDGGKKRPLFVCDWTGWKMRALADQSLHGTERCKQLQRKYDNKSALPDSTQFSTLWARSVEWDVQHWRITFKEYPLPYFDGKEMHFFGTLVGAEELPADGCSLRQCVVELPAPWESLTVQRNMMPLKYYHDMQLASRSCSLSYGPCWEPCLSMIAHCWNNISAPSKDPSPPLPFWDKMRFLLHGRFLWSCDDLTTSMLSSRDPYNQAECVEMQWKNFLLNWTTGEMLVMSKLTVQMRTASKYDETKILYMPQLKLRILLDWQCVGDPLDHRVVRLCTPENLPHLAPTGHDSYRAFRSQCLDLDLNFDLVRSEQDLAAAAPSDRESVPYVKLYGNTFRCIEILLHTLTLKNRHVRKGVAFGVPAVSKPQLSKHFRNVHISVTVPRFFITYQMTRSSPHGFAVHSEGLIFSALVRLGPPRIRRKRASDKYIKKLDEEEKEKSESMRKREFEWATESARADLTQIEIEVYGEGLSIGRPSKDGERRGEGARLASIQALSYARDRTREVVPGNTTPLHKLTVNELKAKWREDVRDACLTIADGVHRAHLLRSILTNDAVKILEFDEDMNLSSNETQWWAGNMERTAMPDGGRWGGGKAGGGTGTGENGLPAATTASPATVDSRRGTSEGDGVDVQFLHKLIDDHRKVAQCEQVGDLPTGALIGVEQCRDKDDVKEITWQVDLHNSQVLLVGCEVDGFLLITASDAHLKQKIHNVVCTPKASLGKSSWSAELVGMQYFAPAGLKQENDQSPLDNRAGFQWLPNEVIAQLSSEMPRDRMTYFAGQSQVVGGNIDLGSSASYHRIISRCSCQIYFCYFDEMPETEQLEALNQTQYTQYMTCSQTMFGESHTSSSAYEEKMEVSPLEGIDCLTLRHNMVEASTSCAQYQMMVDIVNKLVLYIDPAKKALVENRRKMRFEMQYTEMSELKEQILQLQTSLRENVSLARNLERKLFYLEQAVSGGGGEEGAGGRVDETPHKVEADLNECKQSQLHISDKLATTISCYKQRQVEARVLQERRVEDDWEGEAVARRFEVCFEECSWLFSDVDQCQIAQTQIRNFLYTRTLRMDNSGEHLFEVGSIHVNNLEADAPHREALYRDNRVAYGGPAIRVILRDMPPVGGISLKEHFEVNVCPMVTQLTHSFYTKVWNYLFPDKDKIKTANRGEIQAEERVSLGRRLANVRSSKTSMGRKESRQGLVLDSMEQSDLDKMRERADKNNFFLYIKIPEVPFVVTWKGRHGKNIQDVTGIQLLFPVCEWHEKHWTWLDLSIAVKQRCKRVLIQQYMKQKLLRNRLVGLGAAEKDIVNDEEKKRIALGSTSTMEKKKKRK